jgi:hypothetical protein
MAKSKNPDPRTGVDYEKLGRAVESTLVRDYIDLLGSTRRQIWSSFVRGIFMGFGSVIGATVVVALVLWLLHTLGGLPVVGQYLQGAGETIQHK